MDTFDAELADIVLARLGEHQCERERDAMAVLKAAGYCISKPKAKSGKAKRQTVNAVGKPYSAQYDPNYKMKHKPARYVTGTAGRSTAAKRHAATVYRGCIEAKHAGNATLIAEICERNGVTP